MESDAAMMNSDETWYLNKLMEHTVSEADQMNCIEVLQVLLSPEALPLFVRVVADKTRSEIVRRRAAEAIRELGPESVMNELVRLNRSSDDETRALLRIAGNF